MTRHFTITTFLTLIIALSGCASSAWTGTKPPIATPPAGNGADMTVATSSGPIALSKDDPAPVDTTMTPQDLQNARAIWLADTTPWGPVGVNCIDKLIAHWPEIQRLVAPIPVFKPAAPVVGPASAIAAAMVGVDQAKSDAAARLAIARAGLPIDVHVACSPLLLTPSKVAAEFGVRGVTP